MHRPTSMTHEKSERGIQGGKEERRLDIREEGVAMAVKRWMCEQTDDRTDGVHKAP